MTKHLFVRNKGATVIRARVWSLSLCLTTILVTIPTTAPQARSQVSFGVSLGVSLFSRAAAARARHNRYARSRSTPPSLNNGDTSDSTNQVEASLTPDAAGNKGSVNSDSSTVHFGPNVNHSHGHISDDTSDKKTPPATAPAGSGVPNLYRRHHFTASTAKIDNENRAIQAYNRGTELLGQEQYESALEALLEAIQIDPGMLEARWNTAIAFEKLQDYNGSLDQMKAALSKCPLNSEYLFMAGEACQHLRKYEDSEQYYKKYLEITSSGNNAELANRAVSIIDNNILKKPEGDYFADATKDCLTRWSDKSMPLKVYINHDENVNGYRPEFCTALKHAFEEWSSISDGKVRFVFIEKPSDANITCAWTADQLKLAGGTELGITHTRGRSDGVIMEASIDFYTMAGDPRLSKEEVLAKQKEVDLHEIGHALGLEHSQQPYDIMYPEVCPAGLECALNERDKNTILALYSKRIPHIASSAVPNQSER